MWFLTQLAKHKTLNATLIKKAAVFIHSCITVLYIYLQVPAHQEPPEQAQPPSVMRSLVHFLLSPEDCDMMWRLEQWVTGPEAGRHKISWGPVVCMFSLIQKVPVNEDTPFPRASSVCHSKLWFDCSLDNLKNTISFFTFENHTVEHASLLSSY